MPLHNEEAMVPSLARSLASLPHVLQRETRAFLVDDASTDATWHLMTGLNLPWVSAVRLEHRGGQHRAVLRGMVEALRDPDVEAVALMDADLDPPPCCLRELLEALGEHDMVVGARRGRRRSLARKGVSAVFNAVCRMVAPSPISDHGSMFRALRREVAERVVELSPLGACIPVLCLVAARKPGQVWVNAPGASRPSRYSGKTVASVARETILAVARLWIGRGVGRR